MAGLSHLRDVYEKRGKEFLENLLNKTVIINEKIEGAYFGAKEMQVQINLTSLKRTAKLATSTGFLVSTTSRVLNILRTLGVIQ